MQELTFDFDTIQQFVCNLRMPTFIVDLEGTLVYYNQAAETILGRKFSETGKMPAEEWGTIFLPTDEAGVPLLPHELPLAMAVRKKRPYHRDFWIKGLDDVYRHLEVTAFPLLRSDGDTFGAAAIFWEEETIREEEE